MSFPILRMSEILCLQISSVRNYKIEYNFCHIHFLCWQQRFSCSGRFSAFKNVCCQAVLNFYPPPGFFFQFCLQTNTILPSLSENFQDLDPAFTGERILLENLYIQTPFFIGRVRFHIQQHTSQSLSLQYLWFLHHPLVRGDCTNNIFIYTHA